MSNYQQAFKQEIQRLARKEIRQQLESTTKAVARYRSEIAELKRRQNDLERQIRAVASHAAKQAPGETKGEMPAVRRRFSAKSLKTHRLKVGLSQAEYAQLVGTSVGTIWNWETGKTRPDAKHLEILAALRGIGKREARRRLDDSGEEE
jgi:DNA-binding transcriptional regulator YiaG